MKRCETFLGMYRLSLCGTELLRFFLDLLITQLRLICGLLAVFLVRNCFKPGLFLLYKLGISYVDWGKSWSRHLFFVLLQRRWWEGKPCFLEILNFSNFSIFLGIYSHTWMLFWYWFSSLFSVLLIKCGASDSSPLVEYFLLQFWLILDKYHAISSWLRLLIIGLRSKQNRIVFNTNILTWEKYETFWIVELIHQLPLYVLSGHVVDISCSCL